MPMRVTAVDQCGPSALPSDKVLRAENWSLVVSSETLETLRPIFRIVRLQESSMHDDGYVTASCSFSRHFVCLWQSFRAVGELFRHLIGIPISLGPCSRTAISRLRLRLQERRDSLWLLLIGSMPRGRRSPLSGLQGRGLAVSTALQTMTRLAPFLLGLVVAMLGEI